MWGVILFGGLGLQVEAQDFERYAKANAALNTPVECVFMGNSITDFWFAADSAFFIDHHFANRGIGGQLSTPMLARFRQDVIELHPKRVVILAGINDLAFGGLSTQQVLGNLVSMCELARSNGITPILCSLLPCYIFGYNEKWKMAEPVREMNEKLRDYATQAKISYVDYYTALTDERGGLPECYSKDGVHPNAAGYQIMESIILPYALGKRATKKVSVHFSGAKRQSWTR